MSEHAPHIRELISILRDWGATDVRLIPGGKHPKLAFSYEGREFERPVAGTPRNPGAEVAYRRQELARLLDISNPEKPKHAPAALAAEMVEPGDAAHKVPVIILQDGEAWADSRDVAAHFNKAHAHVLRDIRELHCSDQFRKSNYGSFKVNDLTGESTSHVMMTKDGFAFLVMGFTGPKAGKAKEAWIAEFNRMEGELARIGKLPADLAELVRRTDGIARMLSHKVTGMETEVGQIGSAVLVLAEQVKSLIIASDPRRGAVNYVAALQIAIDRKVPSKGRRPLVQRISNALVLWCEQHDGLQVRRAPDSKTRLFPIEAVEPWLKAEGALMIHRHIDSLSNQPPLFGLDAKVVRPKFGGKPRSAPAPHPPGGGEAA